MKLIIQIPCYNEEKTLPLTLNDLPQKVEGFSEVEVLIIDDGSTDRTVEVAREHGVDHIVNQMNNRGLAHAFMAGMDACLKLGADVIVNTDGDNQYYGGDIPRLVQPILEKKAVMSIGDRETDTIDHFSPSKKRLQKLGSGVVRSFSESDVVDSTSGFRAYSRDAAMRMNVVSDYTYTLETIIDAGLKKMPIANVPIKTNEKTRESRLFNSNIAYIRKSAMTIIRTALSKNPLRLMLPVALIFFIIGMGLSIRYLVIFLTDGSGGHVQSLLLAAILLILAFVMVMFAFLMDANSSMRRVVDDLLYRVKKIEYDEYAPKRKKEADEEIEQNL